MKLIASITVDLVRSPLGTDARLKDALGGKPVLRRTMERVLAARGLDAVHVIAPAEQAEEVRGLLEGLNVELETHAAGPAPYEALVRAGRWWGLDGWRGGIGEMCAFDEDIRVDLLEALARRVSADAVVSIPAAAAVIDPALIDAMVQHYRERAGDVLITIVQAPPGLGAVILGRSLLEDLAPTGHPPGVLLAYHPDRPKPDLTGKDTCYRPPAVVIEARGRLLCDTRRSFDRVRDLFDAGGETWDAVRIASWLSERAPVRVDPVPEEIEIELTTDDPLAAGTILRPRGEEVGARGPLKLDTLRSVVSMIEDYDDVRIVLGGFGDPCCHPEFREICGMLRGSRAAAIAVRTPAAKDDPAIEEALFETPVDVVEVTLDAATPETYRRVHGVDGFEDVMARVERWISRRSAGRIVLPLIVPSLIKADETFEDIEAFYDSWQRRLGMALVTGYSTCASQRVPRAVTSVAPGRQGPCLRARSRMLILADGRLTTCDQDFNGRQALGQAGKTPLRVLWRADPLAAIRSARYDDLALCPKCDEWHRP